MCLLRNFSRNIRVMCQLVRSLQLQKIQRVINQWWIGSKKEESLTWVCVLWLIVRFSPADRGLVALFPHLFSPCESLAPFLHLTLSSSSPWGQGLSHSLYRSLRCSVILRTNRVSLNLSSPEHPKSHFTPFRGCSHCPLQTEKRTLMVKLPQYQNNNWHWNEMPVWIVTVKNYVWRQMVLGAKFLYTMHTHIQYCNVCLDCAHAHTSVHSSIKFTAGFLVYSRILAQSGLWYSTALIEGKVFFTAWPGGSLFLPASKFPPFHEIKCKRICITSLRASVPISDQF